MNCSEVDPRVLRTRQLLQKALLELMGEKPFQHINVSDITQRATINRATFYLHYLDKFDLLSKTARETFTQAVMGLLEDWTQFEASDIKRLVHATCDYLHSFLRGCSPANKAYEPLIIAEMQSVLYDFIYCWLDRREGHPTHTLPLETAAMVTSASVLHMSLKWSQGHTTYSVQQVADEMYETLLHGILVSLPSYSLVAV